MSHCRSSKTCPDVEGRYANYFEVGHNEFEFIIDFGQFCHDDNEEVRVHSRIITNPAYMRTLLEVLRKSYDEYEQTFGLFHREV